MCIYRVGEGTKHNTSNNLIFLIPRYITSQKKREATVAKPITAASAPAAGTVVVAKDVDTGVVSPAAVGDGGLPAVLLGAVGEGVVPGSAGEVGDEVQLSKSQPAPLR